MRKQTRHKFSAEFKTKVVLDALKERQTVEALAKTYEIHSTRIATWKKEFLSKAGSVFDAKSPAAKTGEPDTKQLCAQTRSVEDGK